MSKQWKCPFCGSVKAKTLDQKTTGVWFVRRECEDCAGTYTATKRGVRPETGPDPLKVILNAGKEAGFL